jgi:hypothetical protein
MRHAQHCDHTHVTTPPFPAAPPSPPPPLPHAHTLLTHTPHHTRRTPTTVSKVEAVDTSDLTASFLEHQVELIVADIKERVSRVSDRHFIEAENINVPSITYEVRPHKTRLGCAPLTAGRCWVPARCDGGCGACAWQVCALSVSFCVHPCSTVATLLPPLNTHSGLPRAAHAHAHAPSHASCLTARRLRLASTASRCQRCSSSR